MGHKHTTKLIHTGICGENSGGAVNPPVQRASTILFDCAEDIYGQAPKRHYGTQGMEVHDALKAAFNELEHAKTTILSPSGLAACTLPLLALCKAGDHLLLSDNIYGPTRKFCDGPLKRFGIETSYFEPRIGTKLSDLVQENTKLVFMEAPGSLTMEISDIPALVSVCKQKGLLSLIDNTWAAGWFLQPLDMGVDVSIHAATKYPGGHSDVLLGSVSANDPSICKALRSYDEASGNMVSPDDAWLVLRGLRSMGARLAQHQRSAMQIANWLSKRDEVELVLHPALKEHPDHAIWKRDFSGACGLFSFVLRPVDERKVLAFLNKLQLFGLGFSWGGYESLAIHCDPQLTRSASNDSINGPLLRLSIGLEDPMDLQADLEQALIALGN